MSLTSVVRSSALVLALGCAGEVGNTARLAGKVTLDGKPIPADAQAAITFQPELGSTAKPVTVPIKNSTYDSPNTPRGFVTAIFNLNIPTGKMVMSERIGKEVAELETVTLHADQVGGISLEVESNETIHDFELKRAE